MLADTLGFGPGQTPLQAGVVEAVGGPISGPAGADVSSSEGGGDLNARGGDVALVFAGVGIAGRARVAGFERVGWVREGEGEEGEEDDGSEDGFHGCENAWIWDGCDGGIGDFKSGKNVQNRRFFFRLERLLKEILCLEARMKTDEEDKKRSAWALPFISEPGHIDRMPIANASWANTPPPVQIQ